MLVCAVMNTEQLRELLATRELLDFQCTVQDFPHSLKLMLHDSKTGELGILEITPDALVLNYRYEAQA